MPEEEYNLDEICDNMTEAYKKGKRYILVVVAEGAGSGQEIGQYIAEKTQLDTRVSVLGHIQRGGSPSVIDRVRASQLGEQAALATTRRSSIRTTCISQRYCSDPHFSKTAKARFLIDDGETGFFDAENMATGEQGCTTLRCGTLLNRFFPF